MAFTLVAAHPEGNDLSVFGDWVLNCCDNSLDNIGNADSYAWHGPNWAQAGNVPPRMYKSFTGQGGIRVPALFHHAGGGINRGKREAGLAHVMDVLPTVLEAVGVEHPGEMFQGRTPIEDRHIGCELNRDLSAYFSAEINTATMQPLLQECIRHPEQHLDLLATALGHAQEEQRHDLLSA